VINKKTMTATTKGHITHKYKLSQSSPGDPVRWKRTAWALLHKHNEGNDDSIDVPTAALHFPKWREFSSNQVSCNLKGKWANQIMNKLDAVETTFETYNPAEEVEFKAWGGDTNNFRKNHPDCDPGDTPLYANATSRAPVPYRDVIVTLVNPTTNPIDFLFTTGNIAAAGVDENTPTGSGPSEHDARWGLIEVEDTTPPTVPDPINFGNAGGQSVLIRGWRNSLDGGSGLQGYRVYRKIDAVNEDWEPLGMTLDNKWTDSTIQEGVRYFYKTVAVDFVPLESDPPNMATCEPTQGGQPCVLGPVTE
jgi:hypothetical protein